MGWQDPFPTLPYGEPPIRKNDRRLAKAWAKWNGTGVVSLDASENVSSITDVGVGRFGVNYTTAFSSANYAALATGSMVAGASPTYADIEIKLAGSSQVEIWWDSGSGATFTKVDVDDISFAAFGDQ